MAKLRVDFNSVDSDGFVRSRLSRADGPLEVGEMIEAFDSEGAHCKAMVVAINAERGTVRISPDLSTWWNDPQISYEVDPRLGWIQDATLIRVPVASTPVTGTASSSSIDVSRDVAACR